MLSYQTYDHLSNADLLSMCKSRGLHPNVRSRRAELILCLLSNSTQVFLIFLSSIKIKYKIQVSVVKSKVTTASTSTTHSLEFQIGGDDDPPNASTTHDLNGGLEFQIGGDDPPNVTAGSISMFFIYFTDPVEFYGILSAKSCRCKSCNYTFFCSFYF